MNENRQKIKIKRQGCARNVILKLSVKNTQVWRELENWPHVLLFPRRQQIALINVVDFGAKLASAQKAIRSEHVTQPNGGVVQKSSIRKLPIRELKMQTFLGRR